MKNNYVCFFIERMAKPTLQDLKARFLLSQNQLGQKFSEDHLMEVSMIIDDHQVLGPHLGLSEPAMATINPNLHITLQRMKMLQMWRQKCDWNATYNEIIKILLRLEKAEQARYVCELLTKCKYYTAWSCGYRHVVKDCCYNYCACCSCVSNLAAVLSQCQCSVLNLYITGNGILTEHLTIKFVA